MEGFVGAATNIAAAQTLTTTATTAPITYLYMATPATHTHRLSTRCRTCSRLRPELHGRVRNDVRGRRERSGRVYEAAVTLIAHCWPHSPSVYKPSVIAGKSVTLGRMSRRHTDADALRWLSITLAIDEAISDPKTVGVAALPSPKCWVTLVYLDTRPDKTAKYAEVLAGCRMIQSTFSRILKDLEAVGYVSRSFDSETREVLLQATAEGRDAVGKLILHASKRDT